MNFDLCDFHTHSTASDGQLTRLELIQRFSVKGFKVVALTDHVGKAGLKELIESTLEDCEFANRNLNIKALAGVELTHVPPSEINDLAKKAKAYGAQIVIVHGETIVEPVPKGTNKAAVNSKYVNILSHPGLITDEDALSAAKNDVILEISARAGHSLTNGHVLQVAEKANARLILNSDTHAPGDIIDKQLALGILAGTGATDSHINNIVNDNVKYVLRFS